MNRFVLAFLAFAALPAVLSAAPDCGGLFNSPKGFGASVQTEVRDGRFNSFDVFADIYGMPTGRAANYPGIRVQAFRNFVLSDISMPADFSFIYAGMGMSAGYVRDFESFTRWERGPAYLLKNMGAVCCLSSQFGAKACFGGIILDLGLQMDLGLFVRKHETQGNLMLELYKNGLYNVLLPQLKIMWRF